MNKNSSFVSSDLSLARDCVPKYYDIEHLPTDFSHLSLLHINMRDLSAGSKFDILLALINSKTLKHDVIAVGETWLNNTNVHLYNIPEYQVVHNCRKNRGGGGLSVYIHNSFTILKSIIFSTPDESIQLTKTIIQRRQTESTIIACYSNNTTNYIQLTDLVESLLRDVSPDAHVIFAGDTNVNLLVTNLASTNYQSKMSRMGFINCVDLITRPASASCLDHIAIKNIDNIAQTNCGVIQTRIFSDHDPTFITIAFKHKQKTNSTRKITEETMRLFNNSNKLKFLNKIKLANWNPVYETTDPENAMNNFYQILWSIYDYSFPLIINKRKKK
jgi:hypothetical protein